MHLGHLLDACLSGGQVSFQAGDGFLQPLRLLRCAGFGRQARGSCARGSLLQLLPGYLPACMESLLGGMTSAEHATIWATHHVGTKALSAATLEQECSSACCFLTPRLAPSPCLLGLGDRATKVRILAKPYLSNTLCMSLKASALSHIPS